MRNLTIALDETLVENARLYAARKARCQTVFSEDMNDGQTIASITIRNPFRAS